LNILVIEDEAHVAELIRTILEEMGNVCLLARSAEEADRVLDRQAVDAVTLDLGMPGRDGLEWLGSVAGRNPSLARRTLIITGMQLESEVILLVTRYGAGVLAKPFTVDGLQEAVSSQIGRVA
jgi:DNA-binding response OmpR family regulator